MKAMVELRMRTRLMEMVMKKAVMMQRIARVRMKMKNKVLKNLKIQKLLKMRMNKEDHQ